MRITIAFVIVIWFLASIYLGCGGITSLELAQNKEQIDKMVVDVTDTVGVIYNGMPLQNKSAAIIRKADEEYSEKYNLALKFFPLLNLPYNFLGLLVTSFAFGTLGATISLLKDIAIDNVLIENVNFFSKPFLGGGTGIIILSVSYILPLLFVTGETQIRSLSIVFASLFGGLFTDKFFEWLSSIFGKIFTSKTT